MSDADTNRSEDTYRTVRPCKSTGAPEITAATPSGVLPSTTFRGTGENDLELHQHIRSDRIVWVRLRCTIVHLGVVVWCSRRDTRSFL